MIRWLLRVTGLAFLIRRTEFNRPRLSLQLIKFGNDSELTGRWTLCVLNQFVRLWDSRTPLVDPDGMLDGYGVYYCSDLKTLVLCWGSIRSRGSRHWRIPMPWQRRRLTHEALLKDGTWRKLAWIEGWLSWRGLRYAQSPWKPEELAALAGQQPDPPYPDVVPQWVNVRPFFYRLRSGAHQDTVATITCDRSKYTWALFCWLRLPIVTRCHRALWFSLADEIGAGVGSYKGGTVGAGDYLKRGELPLLGALRIEIEWSKRHRFG
jgi:hypothetical protein